MKFFLLIILFCLFVVIAIAVYLYYLYRLKIFHDLVYICKYLKNNISFNKNNINILLTNSFENISQSSRYLLKNNTSALNKAILKNERSILFDFFKSLGKGDVSFEINNINYYQSNFETLETKSKEEMKSKAMTYFKLIIALGLIVCILLI